MAMTKRPDNEVTKIGLYGRKYRAGLANPNNYEYRPEVTNQFISDWGISILKTDKSEFGYLVFQDKKVRNMNISKRNKNHDYVFVNLKNPEGKWRQIALHRLIWLTFNEYIPKGYIVDHIDNNSLNNDISNLQCILNRDNLVKDRNYRFNQYISTKEEYEASQARKAEKRAGIKARKTARKQEKIDKLNKSINRTKRQIEDLKAKQEWSIKVHRNNPDKLDEVLAANKVKFEKWDEILAKFEQRLSDLTEH